MSMDFIVNEDLVSIEIEGKEFKYKPSTAGDELDWFKDYSYPKEIVKVDPSTGKEEKIGVVMTDEAKLSLCKLRNIVEVPFTKEELNKICGINKEFKDFTNDEKDKFFKKFKGTIYNQLVKEVDQTQESSKKD